MDLGVVRQDRDVSAIVLREAKSEIADIKGEGARPKKIEERDVALTNVQDRARTLGREMKKLEYALSDRDRIIALLGRVADAQLNDRSYLTRTSSRV